MKQKSRSGELILQYIMDHIQEKGYAPTIREIRDAVGLSSESTVHGHVERLVKAGLLHRKQGSPRAIKLVGEPDSAVEELLKSTEGVVLTIGYKGRKYELAGEG